MDSSSYPYDPPFYHDGAVMACIYITLLDNDPVTLSIGNLQSSMVTYVPEFTADVLTYTLPRQPTADVYLQLSQVSHRNMYRQVNHWGRFGSTYTGQ